MALGTFVAGRYSATYDRDGSGGGSPADIGITEEGYEIQQSHFKEVIARTDAYGDTPIDAIHRGLQVFAQFTCIEYLASVLGMAFPIQGTAPGVGAGTLNLGVIGVLDSGKAGILVLTSTTGTPAASSPATMTLHRCIQAENADIRFIMAPTLRKLPIRLRVYPNDSGVFWTTT